MQFLLFLLLAVHSYSVNPAKGTLDVVDGATGKVMSSVAVGPKPTAYVVSPDERRIFVCVGGRAEIAVIDSASLAKMKSIEVGSAPQNIYVTPDNTRLIALSGTKLSIINIRREAVEFEIPLGGAPSSLTIDADKNLVIHQLVVREANGTETVDYATRKVASRSQK
jgi:DNA-binding beta-propeller fold protein YncE